jgi:polyhydroxyalkanoate synthesis regulator phasin
MIEDIRKRVESGISSMPKKPDEMGAAVFDKAKEVGEQVAGFAAGLLEWSATARDRLQGDVTELVYRVVGEMGLASKKEVEALAERVDRLEKPARASRASEPAKEKKKRAAPAGKTSTHRPDSAGSTGSSSDR